MYIGVPCDVYLYIYLCVVVFGVYTHVHVEDDIG